MTSKSRRTYDKPSSVRSEPLFRPAENTTFFRAQHAEDGKAEHAAAEEEEKKRKREEIERAAKLGEQKQVEQVQRASEAEREKDKLPS